MAVRSLPPAAYERALRLVRDVRDPRTPDDVSSRLLDELVRLTGCPSVSDLIFWHDPELTDREVVAEALAYEPFAL